jgi:hypothetical protein
MQHEQWLEVLASRCAEPRERLAAGEALARELSTEEVVLQVERIRVHAQDAGVVETALRTMARIVAKGAEGVKLDKRDVEHDNRFVREAALVLVDAVLTRDSTQLCAAADMIAAGLADNWSQVRYAAAIANRKMIQLHRDDMDEKMWDMILPPMCFNRYYLAEGLRNYSIETWKLTFGDTGKQQVVQRMDLVCKYYIEQVHSENYTVRISACHCISELATKVALPPLKGHVLELIQELVLILGDSHWNVRAAACTAIGDLSNNFIEEAIQNVDVISALEKLFFDPISAVREDAIVSLTILAVKSQNSTLIQQLFNLFYVLMPCLQNSSVRLKSHLNSHPHAITPEMTWKFPDVELEPSECTEIAILIMRELALYFPEKAIESFSLLQAISSLPLATEYLTAKRVLWNSLPILCQRIGKRKFKAFISEFCEDLFEAISRAERLQPLVVNDAASCIKGLVQEIGLNVFKSYLQSPWMSDELINNPLLKEQ